MTSLRSLLSRRRWLASLGAASLTLLAPVSRSMAQTGWPGRPLRIVVPYAPGGTSDAAARLLAERLGPVLGQTVIVENRPGASGTTGIDAVAKATDGHTIAFAAISPLTLNPHLQKLPYDPLRDLVPVAQVMYSPVYVCATPAFKGRSFTDLLAAAKAQPGQVSVATSGMGSVGHLMLEQVSRKAGVRFNHIPYKGGGQVTNDAAGGQFDAFTANPNPALNALIAQGKLRVLAVAAAARLPAFAEAPTLAELGFPEANLSSVFGLFAPARTPPEVVKRLHDEVGRVLADRSVQERLEKLDNVVSPASTDEFAARVRREFDSNAAVIRAAGIRLE